MFPYEAKMAPIWQTLRQAIDLLLSSFPAVGTIKIEHLARPFRPGFLLSGKLKVPRISAQPY
ncbi:MAG: hypothetical protein V4723_02995 [Pseudomonadota bacterium]